MIISAVHLYNFKSFKGLHKIDGLDDNLSRDNNIVLIGGLNGAGKTSFLEAFFLCFYGNGAKNLYPSRGAKHENYQSFVNSLLNNDVKNDAYLSGILEREVEMYVKVFLKDVPLTGNFPKNICLKRTWLFTIPNNLNEIRFKEQPFEIFESDEPIEGLEPTEYEDRINGLLPYEVSQLFLFDGEKIQDFAGDPESEFSNALRIVLGINIYSKLIDDLKVVRGRILAEYNKNKEAGANLAEKQAEKTKKQELIEDNKIKISSINNDLDELDIDLEKIQNETYRVTRIQTNDRSDFEKQKYQLEEEKAILEQEYIDKATDFLPFLLADNLCQDVDNQLVTEEQYANWQAAQQEIEPKINSIIDYVFKASNDTPKPELSSTHKRHYSLRIDKAINEIIFQAKNDEFENLQVIHGISSNESQKVRGFFKSITQELITNLDIKSSRLKDIDFTLSKIRNTQSQAGDNSDEIKRLFDKKGNISERIGGFKQNKNDLDFTNQELKRDIEAINSQITKLGDKANYNEEQRKRIAYCEKLQNVIQDFQKQFQTKRTEDLEVAILDMWNILAHKDRLVRKVVVLPENNFAVELFDANGNKLDKTKLSAGEKEIYAISLLWALVQVSGRIMPIIIDTPFGRLDSLHRSNLVKKYFPKASHQVILLSQDEEIVDEYYEQIQPHIAKELTIEYQNGESFVREGYPFAELVM